MTRGENSAYDTGGYQLYFIGVLPRPRHIFQNTYQICSPQVSIQYSIKMGVLLLMAVPVPLSGDTKMANAVNGVLLHSQLLCPTRLTGRTLPPAALRCGFTLTASLWSLVVHATTSLGEHTILLNLAGETFERYLERITRVHFDLAHSGYQRDRRSLLRPELCD